MVGASDRESIEQRKLRERHKNGLKSRLKPSNDKYLEDGGLDGLIGHLSRTGATASGCLEPRQRRGCCGVLN